MENPINKLSHVLDSVMTNQFYAELLAWLANFIAFDNALICSFNINCPPYFLSKEGQINNEPIHRLYLQGAYLSDPFYQRMIKSNQPQFYMLNELTSADFYHTDYYLNFYQKTGWRDEAGLLIEIEKDNHLGIFFGNTQDAFTVNNANSYHLQTLTELIRSLTRLHRDIIGQQNISPEILPLELTPRECEIVKQILSGKGSAQIAQTLFISTGTVKNHRKNIYHKLNINSQAELFNLFMHPNR